MIDCAELESIENILKQDMPKQENLQLYLPEKYPVIFGNQSSPLALCTCWSDPKMLVKAYPQLLEKFCLIGSLYSPEGVSILIRNLALNPQIRTVLLWANSPLSQTAIGRTGSNALFSLFKDGVENDHIIKNTSTHLHTQLDLGTIRIILHDVVLENVSSRTIPEIISTSYTINPSFERHSQSFPLAVRESSAPLPSEHHGWVIHKKNVVDAWLAAVERIMRYGSIEPTEYGSQQKALRTLQWVINDPSDFSIPSGLNVLREKLGLSKNSLDEYSSYFLDPTSLPGISYTYGGRLCGYKGGSINQIEAIIGRLKENPHSRRAVAIVIDPELDASSTSPPCLNHLQVVVDKNDNKVHLIALFRSHDIFKAGLMNAFGLCGLVRHIATQLGKPVGSLTLISNIAHIYEEDWNDVSQLVACQVEGAIQTRFNEHTDIDPRGLVRINVHEKKLHLTLSSYQGDELVNYAATTARELVMQLAKRNLLSRADHYCDITLEAVKAELALKTGVEYIQDRPVRVGEIFLS